MYTDLWNSPSEVEEAMRRAGGCPDIVEPSDAFSLQTVQEGGVCGGGCVVRVREGGGGEERRTEQKKGEEKEEGGGDIIIPPTPPPAAISHSRWNGHSIIHPQ